MGFLKKKSATKLSGGDFLSAMGKSTSSASRAPPPVIASHGESRDDSSAVVSVHAARARVIPASPRSRSHSDTAVNNLISGKPASSLLISKPASSLARDHRRDESMSSFVMKQTSVGPAKMRAPMKSQLSKRPSDSAQAKSIKSKDVQPRSPKSTMKKGAGRGRSKSRTYSETPRSKPTRFKSKKSTRMTPKIKNGWRTGSVSSNDSSDDSDDDCEGSDGSYTDEDGFTDEAEDSTMYTKESGSFVSLEDNTTNDTDDKDLSVLSSNSEEFNAKRLIGPAIPSPIVSSPRIIDMLGKIGCNANTEVDTEDDGNTDNGLSSQGSEATKLLNIGRSKESAHSDFMRKMDEFVAKNPDHQVIVQVTEHGNIEKLSLQELSYIPRPNKPTDIVIKVDCSTINLQDCMVRRGKWYEMQKLPFIPGSDFVGTIHEIGSEVAKYSTFEVGNKVAALVPSGGNSKYITIEYTNIIRVPPEVDSESALCLSSTYVPAREALDLGRKMNTPFTGANILVIGGNGPSGLATIELALLEGANVFTTADERHHEYLATLGAKCFPIDPAKWLPTLNGKMDVVLDSVCLDGYESSIRALNSSGTLVCTGMSAVYTQGAIPALLMKDVRDCKATYYKMRVKHLWDNAVYYDRMERFALAPNEYAQHFRYLCHIASKGTIKPLVSTRAPLNKVASLQRAIELGNTSYGICVCAPWTTPFV